MTDAEFEALRPGDKVASGNQIAFDALPVTGPHNSNGEVPIQVVDVDHPGYRLWTMCTRPIALGIIPRSKTCRAGAIADGSARVAAGGVEPGGFTSWARIRSYRSVNHLVDLEFKRVRSGKTSGAVVGQSAPTWRSIGPIPLIASGLALVRKRRV